MTDGPKAVEGEREVRPGSELAPSRLSSTLDPSNGDHPKLTTDDTDHDDLKKTCKGLFLTGVYYVPCETFNRSHYVFI